MNYGRFFRLNQNLSRIEKGFAIYDYIDLPAYFAPSISNRMSPKYPISVIITSNSVAFRLHYSALKIEESKEKQYLNPDKNYPRYYYDKDSADKVKLGDETKIAHMAEVILELPYTDTINRNLSDTIKSIYRTNFPQILKGNQINCTHEVSTGGRFLERLIRKRYPEVGKPIETNDVDAIFYDALRKASDGTTSYSTLWLMELVQGEKHNRRYCRTNKEGKIVGFLRKLLLDFMFDLKHSDVFQNSVYYQTMYSGLMSDFYFSALMHKCDYYYYRELTEEAVWQFEESKKNICDIEKNKERIAYLYAEELFKAENLWIQDIMNPMADTSFNHLYFGKDEDFSPKRSNFLSSIWDSIKNEFSRYKYRRWDSWFAEPEEEMRRVCFTMEDEQERLWHICNTETLSEYLQLEKKKEDIKKKGNRNTIIARMIDCKDNSKVAISQWFLKRYSIIDVLHMHLFKMSFLPFFVFLLAILVALFLFPGFVTKGYWVNTIIPKIIPCVLFCFGITALYFWIYIGKLIKRTEPINVLLKARRKMVYKRLLAIILTISLFGTILYFIPGSYFWVQIPLIVLGGVGIYRFVYKVHWLSNMHVLYPRLIASITAAWLSLAIGNELFGTFFDSLVSWSTSIWLAVMVFIFVMYEINKMLPLETIFNKAMRCLGIMSISYLISLVVGLFIINFTGERFLERSGVLEGFYAQYVEQGHERQVEHTKYKFTSTKNYKEETSLKSSGTITITGESKLKDSLTRDVTATGDFKGQVYYIENDNPVTDAERLKDLEEVYINTNEEINMNHPIVTTWKLGDAKFFILRDFLIQFAFVAMFIGIFIQMIFEEKSITEI